MSTAVDDVVVTLRRLVRSGRSLEEAAWWYVRQHPDAATRVMEEIGSHPSSEPELRQLQLAWERTLPGGAG